MKRTTIKMSDISSRKRGRENDKGDRREDDGDGRDSNFNHKDTPLVVRKRRLPHVKLKYDPKNPPLVGGSVNVDALMEVVLGRGLNEKKSKWSHSDMHAICNVFLPSQNIVYPMDLPYAGNLLAFYNRISEEVEKDKDGYFKMAFESMGRPPLNELLSILTDSYCLFACYYFSSIEHCLSRLFLK
jgi:hypothetical protein